MQKHNIPLSAIPCLHYKRDLDKDRTKPAAALSKSGAPGHAGTQHALNHLLMS